MKDYSLLEKAAAIAVEGHKEQKRHHGAPYIVHPFMVAQKLIRHGFDDTTVAAALIHDVLEDTDIEHSRIIDELGQEVYDIVVNLSEDKTLPWKERKLDYIEKVRNGSKETQAVSLSDKIHNIENMRTAYEEMGDELWTKFGRGKEERLWFDNQMATMFQEMGWEHPLLEEYVSLIRDFEQE